MAVHADGRSIFLFMRCQVRSMPAHSDYTHMHAWLCIKRPDHQVHAGLGSSTHLSGAKGKGLAAVQPVAPCCTCALGGPKGAGMQARASARTFPFTAVHLHPVVLFAVHVPVARWTALLSPTVL